MKKLCSISMIAAIAMLLATAGCIAPMSDEAQDVSGAESLLIDLTSDRDSREEAEDVVDAEAPDLEELDTSDIDPVPCSTDCSISTVLGDETKTVGDWYNLLIETSPGCVIIWEIDTDNTTPALDGFPSGSGLSFGSSGNWSSLIQGTPLVDDVYNITVTAKVGGEPVDSKSFTLTVLPAGNDDLTFALSDPCSEPLKISWVVSGVNNEPDVEEVEHTLGEKKRSVKLTVTGGMDPYKWTVNSRVKDSYHKHNVGGGDPSVHFTGGITNYKYWNSDDECLTPEEFLDIYGETIVLGDDEEEEEETDSFWPDCSPPVSSDVKFECEELGCGGYWYDMSDKMQEQCTNGFDCSGANWQSLTTTQRKACMEHQSEENMEKVHEAMEDAYGTPKYICKWTEDPTWRKEGVELPLHIDTTGSYAHPSSNWDWNPPEQYGNWTPEESYETDGETITFVSDMEFDGPLPVDRQKYMGEKRPVERLTFTVRDSCSVPQKAVALLDADLEYPDTSITDFEVEILFTNLHFEAEGHEKLDDFYVDFMFMSAESEAASHDEAGYPSLIKHVGVEAHFGIANWINPNNPIVDEANVCKGESCSESVDIGISEESDLDPSDVPTVKDVTGIYMQIELGSDWHLEQKLGDGVVGWNEYTEYGDMDIKHIYIGSRYWRAHYDDARAGNVFDKDVNKGNIGQRWLSDEDGWEDMNNNGAPFGFHRRALFGGKFIP